MPIEAVETRRRREKPGAYFGIPLPIWVLVFLAGGLLTGLFFPKSSLAAALYTSGTYFPKTVVTLASLIVFILLSGATAKLVLLHRRRARRLFGLVLALYVAVGVASLLWVAIWIPVLTRLSFDVPGVAVGVGRSLRQLAAVFSTLLSDQPLIQVLAAAVFVGYGSARFRGLHSIAHGLMIGSEGTLWLFKKLLWYYPLMIGCLGIGIPLKFGIGGMSAYGQTILWVGVVTVSFSVLMIGVVKLTTRRTFRQLFSYFAAVWPTGFGTGGSYETLALNVVSAEYDLGLRQEIAEVSIVFGTVLNKSCATMSVMLVTISVARLLHVPISLEQIVMLIPPVLILGLESPGIPGGAAFFMSPIVAVLLHVQNVDVFVATFVTMYSGLIPMFSTAGNTTNDGMVGALLNDRFAKITEIEGEQMEADQMKAEQMEGEQMKAAGREPRTISGALPQPGARTGAPHEKRCAARGLRLWIGWILLAPGAWMLIAPQARLGVKQLQWMNAGAFRGEVLLGVLLISAATYLLSIRYATDERGGLRAR